MLETIKSLLGSKKFLSAVFGSALVTGLTLAHMPLPLVVVVGTLFGLHIGAQGFVDGQK